MHTFAFRPRLESLEDRTTPATTAQIQSAAAETQYLAAQIRTFSHDFEWMSNPKFRSFVENYAKNVWFDGTVEIKTFNEAISSLHSQVAARPALAGVLGPQLSRYAQLQAQARSNMAFAQNIGAWLGFTVAPTPAPSNPAPKATNVTSPTADGTYSVGAAIQIAVTFNKAVNVTGTPKIALNTGGSASFTSGSGTTTLTFTYTVGATDGSVGDLDYTSISALTLNGGTIVDKSTSQIANLKLSTPGAAGSLGANKNIVISATTAVSSVTSSTADGTYSAGTTIPITVVFNKAVTVTGTPQIALNTGGTATFASGSGSTSLTFNYTVGAADVSVADLDYTSVSALTLNGGTIVDQATSQAATLTLPGPGAAGSLGANKNIVISATDPTVTSTTADGTYVVGNAIAVTVRYNAAVVVTGTPQIALNTGGTATFASGSGSTSLTFNYTVGAADASVADLDYSSVNALTLNGGTIVDQATSQPAAPLTLPAPGTAGSLGANKNIAINAAPNDAGMTNTMPDVNDPSWVAGANGLKTWDVVVGTGTPVTAGSSITVFYTGWLASNGTQFDARRSPSAPVTFALSGLIQGWQQGIPGMQPGGIRRLFVPAALGYGAAGSPPNIPANADLVFEIKVTSHT